MTKKSSNRSDDNDIHIKVERKYVEKKRRIDMKDLCLRLASQIPPHNFKPLSCDKTSCVLPQLDHATSYITQLTQSLEMLKQRREQLADMSMIDHHHMDSSRFELTEMGSAIHIVILITNNNLNNMTLMYRVSGILEEEGAEVITAKFATVGDIVFHTVHARVRISRVGVDISAVNQRLHDLIY